MTRILDKTDKGREEIATRKHGLPSRLRTLLVLIDGKHTQDELLRQVAGLGLTAQSVDELLAQGLIRFQEVAAPSSRASAPAEPEAATAQAEQSNILAPGENQFHALYNFYTSTIKSAIGLRGYALQLKVERAASVDDFRELRRPYLEAVLKLNGKEMARSLRDRLDQLLFPGKPPADLDPML
ncbi:MAG TPA: hypothetical protein VEC06_10035 [Paucimonas sp.]|nr:hypothetical protein [Paucimonas sp.]